MAVTPSGMFPKSLWVSWFWRTWKPIMFGGDEFGRHTLCIGVPLIGPYLVIPYKNCDLSGDCADMSEFQCSFPGCPYTSIVSTKDEPGYCMTHDTEFWTEELARVLV